MRWRQIVLAMFGLLLWGGAAPLQAAEDAPRQLYEQALLEAAAGDDHAAIARLEGGIALLPAQNKWRQRYMLAAGLLAMRSPQQVDISFSESVPQAILLNGYVRRHAVPEPPSPWLPGVLATLLPGAGHAWLHRWRDAGVAALLVWPMLLLTLWAARRRMGPVTLFFGLITVWLWSGTVFSAISLAERADADAYALWWQGLWQASGLPGRPW